MNKMSLIATTAFGLEKIVKNEVINLGYENLKVSDGKVEFEGSFKDIARANIWLRSSDRIQIKMKEFDAITFEELFQNTKSIEWEKFIPKNGKILVTGKSIKSQLGSVRACQSIVKKAIVERLKETYKIEWFSENGPVFKIQIAMLKDKGTLTIDTTGPGLHKRGYRKEAGIAPLRETLSAALVQLSFWNSDRLLVDPFCGSGTILIEAAMIGRNIAPGLKREFVSEQWPVFPKNIWKEEKENARKQINNKDFKLYGYDLDSKNISLAKYNARKAGVGDNIIFETKDLKDLWIDKQHGIIITNPPYGERMGEYKEINQLYITFHKMFKKKLGWSIYVITADKVFPNYFKRSRPDRIRKLFNGPLEVNYYQYYGERPDKSES